MYEECTMNKINLKNGTFIDLGAHICKYSISVANRSPDITVFSVEPCSENYKKLMKNLRVNRLKNIVPLNIAISSVNSNKKLYLEKNKGNGHSLYGDGNNFEVVKTTTLDNLVEKNEIKNVKLIKMDIEGAELDALRGGVSLLKRDKPKILFEAEPTDLEQLRKITEFLENIGYHVEGLEENYYASPINSK